ncbi:MAG: large subunit ribosomal protein L25 [Planctomycetota bacterium]|jgi:large subunit ribosomal protein L25
MTTNTIYTLQATVRPEGVSLEQMRDQNIIPAVYYAKDVPSTSFAMNRQEFIKLFKEAGETSVVTLEMASGNQDCLIREIQIHPVSHKLLHVDFQVIDLKVVTQVNVPVVLIGEAPAAKNTEWYINQIIDEVEIEALPREIPHEIEVDISILEDLESAIYVKDLVLPSSVIILSDMEQIIVSVGINKEEVEEESTGIDFDAIAVEKKGKGEAETPSQ